MTDKQIIDGCEFQSQCIEYKDMYSNKHIKCPIVDFAIACRGENKCKYKTVYEQLKRLENEYEGFAVKYTDMEIALHDKEQECEELKIYIESNKQQIKEVETLVMDNDRLINELDQLKASLDEKNELLQKLGISASGEFHRIKYYVDKLVKENEELKVWKKEHLKDVEFLEKNPVIDILNLTADIILLEQRNDNLKQTLDEIKEIAQKTLNMVDYKTYFKRDNKSLKQEGFKALNEILEKNSEVIPNE